MEKANNFKEHLKPKLTTSLLSCSAKRPVFKALFFDIYCPNDIFDIYCPRPICLSKKKLSSPELRLTSKISLKTDLHKTLFSLTFILKLCRVIS